MKPYRYVQLNASEEAILTAGYQHGKKHHFRERCYGLLLSHRGHTVSSIAQLLNKQLATVRSWMNSWQEEGIKGLEIRSGRGMKPKLLLSDVSLVEEIKKSERTTLKVV